MCVDSEIAWAGAQTADRVHFAGVVSKLQHAHDAARSWEASAAELAAEVPPAAELHLDPHATGAHGGTVCRVPRSAAVLRSYFSSLVP